MTGPQTQQPSAQRPWVQQPGGYPGDGQQQPQQPAPQYPSAMQQPAVPQLPPQMQGGLQQLNGQPSPLNYPAQPQQVQQSQQPAPQQQLQDPGQMRLSGAGVPQELQGRTLQEAISIYNGMRSTHLNLMQQVQGQQQAAQPAPQPQQPAATQQQPAQFDWRNPGQSIAQTVDDRINHAIDQKLMPMLAPIAAQNSMSSINNARQAAAQEIGVQNWTAIEADVLQMLQGADPRALMNPQAWRTAAAAVIGHRAIAASRQTQQPMIQSPQGPGAYPAQQVPVGQNPMPNLNTFFSEQPYQGGPAGGGVQLTATQRQAAYAMGIPEADYAAWSVGIGR